MDSETLLNEYNRAWPIYYEAERKRLSAALGEAAKAIHHIGSTAIPGMPGKGIIDLLLLVESLEPDCVFRNTLSEIGYVHRPIPDRPESPFFTKPSEKPRTHNIHIAESGSLTTRKQLVFRDYLRTNRNAFNKYEKCKRDSAEYHPGDWLAFLRKL